MSRQTISLQFVAYTLGAPSKSVTDHWSKAALPLVSQQLMPGQPHYIIGIDNNTQIKLQLQTAMTPFNNINRIDLFFSANSPLIPGNVPGITDLSWSMRRGLDLIKLVSSSESITRVAIVLQNAEVSTTGLSGALNLLRHRVPGLPVSKGATEATYQLTTEDSTQNGYKLNLIVKWETGSIGWIPLQHTQIGPVSLNTQPTLSESYDIGTIPQSSPIPPGDINNIFDDIAAKCLKLESSGFQGLR